MFKDLIREYNEAIYDTDRHQAMQIVQKALDSGASPTAVIFELVVPAMNDMIQSVSRDFDANLAQHFMTAQIAAEVTDAMLLRIESPPDPIGHIIIGTADGDIHSLGKKIVIGCLKALMIDATDLGVNIGAQAFVDAAVEKNAPVIGVSAMMVHTATGENGPREIRRLLKERNLENKIRLIVGGAPFRFDPALKDAVGADAIAENGVAAADVIKHLIREVTS